MVHEDIGYGAVSQAPAFCLLCSFSLPFPFSVITVTTTTGAATVGVITTTCRLAQGFLLVATDLAAADKGRMDGLASTSSPTVQVNTCIYIESVAFIMSQVLVRVVAFPVALRGQFQAHQKVYDFVVEHRNRSTLPLEEASGWAASARAHASGRTVSTCSPRHCPSRQCTTAPQNNWLLSLLLLRFLRSQLGTPPCPGDT